MKPEIKQMIDKQINTLWDYGFTFAGIVNNVQGYLTALMDLELITSDERKNELLELEEVLKRE